MDGVTGLSRVFGSKQGQGRNGGSQQQADAFREAMQEHHDGTAAEREPEPPMRRGLQPNAPNGRKPESEEHHVDVVA
ncbi:MAG: hypothetical protein ACI89X_001099 [Planctomycetota bacterium]|jgi:hypothetical protein